MGERRDGTWAARQIAVSAPRQNGKTEIIVARALAGILLFKEETIIVSAHQQDTAREVFSRILDLIEANPFLERRVESVMRAVNREYVRFDGGQSIRFKARSKGSGRGFSCDCLLLDEAQILGASEWSAILPTMSARRNPQAWLLGTPPTELDDGEVFARLRTIGLEAKEPRVAYLEWSAGRDEPIDSPQTWAKANPAYGSRIDFEAVATELASMSVEQFRLERLGIWDELASDVPVISAARWQEMFDVGPADGVKPDGFGVDMSHAREISVAACWVEGDNAHIEEVWAGIDPIQAVSWIVEAAGKRAEVLIDAASPAASLVAELRNKRVNVRLTNGPEYAQACGGFENRAETDTLTHGGLRLIAAMAGARKRPIRDAGGWGWDRRDPTSQIHPIVSGTLALLAATRRRRKTGNRTSSTGRVGLAI